RGSSRLQEGARAAPQARGGDAGSGGREGRGAQGLRSSGGSLDRRGARRAAVSRDASPPRLARGRCEAAGAGRRRGPDRDRTCGSRAVTKTIGIDLGTTNSALATADDDTAARALLI